MSRKVKDAIIIEEDYKGNYRRYALTPEEFADKFKSRLEEDMPEAEDFAQSFTFRPMVHIWYKRTKTASDEWNNFFTDMAYGLPDSDVEEGNLAYIAENEFVSLKDDLPKLLYEFYCTVGGDLRLCNSYLLIVEKETEKSFVGRVFDSDLKYEHYDRFRASKETIGKTTLINGRNMQYYKLQLEADSYEEARDKAVKIFYDEILKRAYQFLENNRSEKR